MSFRDIGTILKKASGEKEEKQDIKESLSLSTQAYHLFSKGKTPIQVAITLNLSESETIKFYQEYWNLHFCLFCQKEFKLGFFWWRYCKQYLHSWLRVSPPSELEEWIGRGYLFLVEVLQMASKDTSTSFMLFLSTKQGLVEVVEVVEVLIYSYSKTS